MSWPTILTKENREALRAYITRLEKDLAAGLYMDVSTPEKLAAAQRISPEPLFTGSLLDEIEELKALLKKQRGRPRGVVLNGATLEEHRRALGHINEKVSLSMAEFAEKVGCNLSTIKRAESGESIDKMTAGAIARAVSDLTGKTVTISDLKKK